MYTAAGHLICIALPVLQSPPLFLLAHLAREFYVVCLFSTRNSATIPLLRCVDLGPWPLSMMCDRPCLKIHPSIRAWQIVFSTWSFRGTSSIKSENLSTSSMNYPDCELDQGRVPMSKATKWFGSEGSSIEISSSLGGSFRLLRWQIRRSLQKDSTPAFANSLLN